jgi:hypothetical protein
MKSFLIGTAVGVAATLLVQQLLPDRDAAPAPAPAATTSTEATPVSAASALLAAAPAASAAPVATAPAAALAQPAPVRAAPVTAAATATPLPPLQLSDEHASMLLTPVAPPPPQLTLQEQYARFLAEGEDRNWSFATAQALQGYIANHQYSAEFDVRNVECRQTACVITVFGNQRGSNARWANVLAGMRSEPWDSGFSGSSLSMREVNGRAAIVTLLHRKTAETPKP